MLITVLIAGFSPCAPPDEIGQQPLQVTAMYDWPLELSGLPAFHLKPQFDSGFFRVLSAFSYAVPHVKSCPLLPVLVCDLVCSGSDSGSGMRPSPTPCMRDETTHCLKPCT